MNRLSIVLVIAFVSYSLGAPENIESHSADINHDLEHSGDHELENNECQYTNIENNNCPSCIKRQNGYGEGNVNNDPSASENPIHDTFRCGNTKPKHKVNCRNYCKNDCILGTERRKCLQCIENCRWMNYRI